MRNINHIIWSLIWLLSISISGYSANGTDSGEKSKNVVKRYNYSTGTVEANLKKPKKGDPVDMAYQFLELNKEVFRMKDPRQEMVLEKVTSDDKKSRVILKQVYHGMGVDAGARVFFKNTGELHLFEITYYDDINLSTTPSIDSASAWDIALKDFGLSEGVRVVNHEYRSEFFKAESLMYEHNGLPHPDYSARFEGVATRLLIWRSERDGKLHLVWKICVEQKSPDYLWDQQLWGYYIDAHDGAVLHKGGARSRSQIGH